MNLTNEVRIFSILVNKLAGNRRSYTVRWTVEGLSPAPRRTFTTKAPAETFRSKLLVAHREGKPFDVETGLPITMLPRNLSRPWLQLAIAYVDMKWPRVSAKHRQNIADALATITMSLLSSEEGRPSTADLRDVLYGWAFNTTRRTEGEAPRHLKKAARWLESNTVAVGALDDTVLVREVLDSLTVRDNGIAVAASSVARKRAVFSGVLKYAVELRLLDSHPFPRMTWVAPRVHTELDLRVVVNPEQATALLNWIGEDSPEFEAFFGCLYDCALRPEEALHLKDHEYERPEHPGGWGWLTLTGATVATADGWTDGGGALEDRPLKWRAENATRRVPVPPQQCERLDRHIERFGAAPDGRLFVTRRIGRGKYKAIPGGPFARATYCRVWSKAREAVLTSEQFASPLAKVPYHLRAACISTWLTRGVAVTTAAKWAGHSVQVLMRVYARCLDNHEVQAIRRLETAMSARAKSKVKTPTQNDHGFSGRRHGNDTATEI